MRQTPTPATSDRVLAAIGLRLLSVALFAFMNVGIKLAEAQGAGLADAVCFASANASAVVDQIGAKTGILRQGVVLHAMPLHEKEY